MTLDLDARQRAMLQEMGIAVWAPAAREAAPVSAPVLTPASSAPSAPIEAPTPPASAHAAVPRADTGAAGLATPHAPAPAHTAAPAQRPAAPPSPPSAANATPAAGAAALVLHEPVAIYAQADPAVTPSDLGAGWLIVLESATPHEPLAGDAGKLLDNMLRAMRLHRHPRTWVAALERAQPVQPGAGAEPAAALAQALAAVRPSMVLLLGLGAARSVLGSREPLGRLRAGVHQITGPDGTPVPAVVSYDPAYLLRAPDAKAAAWADLCRSLAIVRGAPSPSNSTIDGRTAASACASAAAGSAP
ncbi:MAG: hypothetical protein EOO33_11560, partial [Comamonadaceae bacterium]